MYLTKRTYVKQWDHHTKAEKTVVKVTKGGKVRRDIKPKRVSEVIEEIGYWRKANQINKWFIDHCGKGEDKNGEELWVSREQLQELRDTCKEVLKASKLVPSKIQNGEVSDPNGNGMIPNMEEGLKIEDTAKAEELLPTESGFFFGGTDYDEYYVEDLKNTIKILDECLWAENKEGNFYYHNSW